jgi:5-oxoprolinase (ATP-hydrolysing) subunit C
MTLHVIEAGLSTWVVDAGRESSRSLGVPVGGAADRAALALGNGLVGNPPHAAALEINLSGPTLRAACPLACVVYGAPFELSIDRRPVRVGQTFMLAPQDQLHIGGTRTGMRAYFCVQGGLQTRLILGSRSSLQPIEAGEDLPCSEGKIHSRRLPANPLDDLDTSTFRVLPGPQADWFNRQELEGRSFRVGPACDRMGLRLVGEAFRLPNKQLVSEPVCPGSVQVTGDGQCIILGVDGQTIGGYPKIAQVISADLDRLGQLRPGDEVRFVTVTLAEATSHFHRRQALLERWLLRLSITSPGINSLVYPSPTSKKNKGQKTKDKGQK